MAKKLTCLDLFSGAGGMSLGFQLGGFEIIGGVEWDKAAAATHERNFPHAKEYAGDIKAITDDEVLEHFKGVDVIVGGPPCQGFSSANRWEKEKDDPRNKLFFEYLRFIRLLRPKAFVIENVRQILTRDNGYAKDRIEELAREMGYETSVRVLLASDYGVPQDRRRAVFVGVQSDYNKAFDFDTLKKVERLVTVQEAIGDLYSPQFAISSEFSRYVRDAKEISNHDIKFPCAKVIERMKYVPQGGNWQDVPKEMWDTQRDNRHSSAYRRLRLDAPSITIDTGHMNYFHPIEHRVPTVRESARLQSFPDSFVFTGNQGEQFRQVGNAVPPLMGKAIAEAVKSFISSKKKGR